MIDEEKVERYLKSCMEQYLLGCKGEKYEYLWTGAISAILTIRNDNLEELKKFRGNKKKYCKEYLENHK